MGCGCNVSDVGLEGSVGVSPGKGVCLYLGFRRLVHLRCTGFGRRLWRGGSGDMAHHARTFLFFFSQMVVGTSRAMSPEMS